MNYRQIPRIANSDLTEYKNLLLFGQAPQPRGPGIAEPAALTFGTAFHHYLLIDTQNKPTGLGTRSMNRMLDVLRSDQDFMSLLARAQAEQPTFWTDLLTGLACKAQLDMIIQTDKLIVDAKTTSAKSNDEFIDNCLRFGYDRQAAFYIDGCRASGKQIESFRIVGIQKQKPHAVFTLELDRQSNFVEFGRKKYQRLLSSWLKQPYRPSSWVLVASKKPRRTFNGPAMPAGTL